MIIPTICFIVLTQASALPIYASFPGRPVAVNAYEISNFYETDSGHSVIVMKDTTRKHVTQSVMAISDLLGNCLPRDNGI